MAYELWSIDNIDISNLERDAQQRNCFRRWYEKNGLVHRVIDGDTTFSHEYSAKLDEIMSGSVWYGYDIADDYKNKIADLEACVGKIVDDIPSLDRSEINSAALSSRRGSSYIENPVALGVGGAALATVGGVAYKVATKKPTFSRRTFLAGLGLTTLLFSGGMGVPAAGTADSKLNQLDSWAKYLDEKHQFLYNDIKPELHEKCSPFWTAAIVALLCGGTTAGIVAVRSSILHGRIGNWLAKDFEQKPQNKD